MGLARQITRNGIYRVLFLLFQFLNTILISRLSGPEGFGFFSLVIVNANLLAMVTSLGIPSGILYHASVRDIPQGMLLRIAWVSTAVQLVAVAGFEFLHFLNVSSFFIWSSPDIAAGLLGAALFLSVAAIEKYHVLYNGYGKLVRYNSMAALFNLFLFIGLALLAWKDEPVPVSAVLTLYILAQLAQLIVLLLMFRKERNGDELAATEKGPGIMSYSLQAYVANVLYFLLTRIDFWILEYFCGEKELGIYALSVRLIQVLLILPIFLSNVVLPTVASGLLPAEKFHRIFRLLNTINLLLLFLILLSGNWLLPLVFGKGFAGSVVVLMILLPGIFFLSAQTMLATYFAARKQVRVNIIAVLLALAVAITGDMILVPVLGARGAAMVSGISYLLSFLYPYIVYLRQEERGWNSLFLERKDLDWVRPLLGLFTKAGGANG